MKTAFIHDKELRRTIAVELPTAEAIQALCLYELTRKHGKPMFNVGVGVAKVHPKDNYCRKTGRDVATSKMEKKQFEVFRVLILNDVIGVTTYNRELGLSLVYKLYRDSGKVRVF